MMLILTTMSLIPLAFINTMWPYLIMFLSALLIFSLHMTFHEITNLYMTSNLFMTDPLSSMLTSLTIWICLIMFISNTKYPMTNPAGKYNNLIIISLFLLLITFNVQSHFLFYLSFESTLIPIIFIIFGWGYQPERIQASTYLLFYTLTASLPLLLALILMNYMNLTNNFSITFMLPLSTNLSMLFWFITILAFLVKMPCFFLHLWLPKAHVEAPMTGSMLLAAILLKLGSYGLMRMLSYSISLPLFLNTLLITSNLMGSIYTSIMCLKQSDVKALIAYSSVVHMSLMASSLLTFSSLAWSSAIILMLGHALCSSALFALASFNYDALFSRSLLMNKGLIMIFPSLTLWWFIFSAFNMSAPPSVNTISEIFTLSSILFWHINTFPYLLLATFLTGVYTYYLYSASQHNLPQNALSPTISIKMNIFLMLSLHLFPILMLFPKLTIFMW